MFTKSQLPKIIFATLVLFTASTPAQSQNVEDIEKRPAKRGAPLLKIEVDQDSIQILDLGGKLIHRQPRKQVSSNKNVQNLSWPVPLNTERKLMMLELRDGLSTLIQSTELKRASRSRLANLYDRHILSYDSGLLNLLHQNHLFVERQGTYLLVGDEAIAALKKSELPYTIIGRNIHYGVQDDYQPTELTSPSFRLKNIRGSTPLWGSNEYDFSIPDADTTGIISPIIVSQAPEGSIVSDIKYRLSVNHTYPGDLRLVLWSDSIQTVLWDNWGGSDDGGYDDDTASDDNIYLNWRSTSFMNGKPVPDSLKLSMFDLFPEDMGNIDYIEVQIFYREPGVAPDLALFTQTGNRNRYVLDTRTNTLEISSSATNIGSYVADTSTTAFYLSQDLSIGDQVDLLLGYESMEAIEEGQQSEMIFRLALDEVDGITEGIYYVGIYFDCFNNVWELDETNNTFAFSEGLPVSPTLSSNLIHYQGEGAVNTFVLDEANDQLDVTISVGNSGPGNAGSFHTGFFLFGDPSDVWGDYTLLGWTALSQLAQGSFVPVVFQADLGEMDDLPEGSYYLGAYIDWFDAQYETDEKDNASYFTDQIPFWRGHLIEAEAAMLQGAHVDSTFDGYSGTGFVVYDQDDNAQVVWTVTADSLQGMFLTFRYALDAGNKTMSVNIDSMSVVPNLHFPATGDWSNWVQNTVKVVLTEGSHQISLATTGTGGLHIDHLTIKKAENVEPEAHFEVDPAEGVIPLLVDFDAASSFDEDGTIVTYDWDFGDGSTGYGITVNHTYDSAEVYRIILTVTDNSGATDTTSLLVSALGGPNQTPNAIAHVSRSSGMVPLSVIFDGSNSGDTDGTIVSHNWLFGDGSMDEDPSPQHTYTVAGSYIAILTVQDDDGAIDSDTLQISVAPSGQLFQLITNSGIRQSQNGSSAWGDYDGDGFLDLVLTGLDSLDHPFTHLYKNESGRLRFVPTDLVQVCFGTAVWGDYDADGDLDLVLTGRDNNMVSHVKIYKYEGETFTDIQAGLVQIGNGSSAAWGDYDNDGDLDLFLAGSLQSGSKSGLLYRNDRGEFIDIRANIGYGINGSVMWGDYDADGDQDLIVTGSDINGYPSANIFRNTNGSFVNINANLTGIDFGSASWGDYDNDGDLDLVLAGINSSEVPVAKIYRNHNAVFNPQINLTGLGGNDVWWGYYRANASVSWIDYDGDGDLDLLISGEDQSGSPRAVLYQNNNNTFVTVSTSIPFLKDGTIAWGDYDNDGDQDLLISGENTSGTSLTQLFANNSNVIFERPSVPTDLTALQDSLPSSFILSWARSDDDTTPQNAISYNINVGTIPGAGDVKPGQALGGTMNGRRQVINYGNAGQTTSYTLTNLEPNTTYYWSVQAIDHNFSGSSFSLGNPFTTSDFTVPITFLNTNAPISGVYRGSLSMGDYDADGDFDMVSTGTSTGSSCTTRLLRKDGGGYVNVSTSIPGVYYSSTAWGDYDNDGDLDLVIAGRDCSNNRITRVYRNDAGSFVDIEAGLVGLYYSSSSWGDYDNDGDLDLVMVGRDGSDNCTTRLYRNDDGSFESISAGLVNVCDGSVAWGDYDNDGDLDLIITGRDSNYSYHAIIYRYQNGNFVNVQAGLTGLNYSSSSWGDYDGDGDLDLVTIGVRSGFYATTKIYQNNNTSFISVPHNLVNVYDGSTAWGDYDNDGDMDLLISGRDDGNTRYTRVFRNDSGEFVDAQAGLTGVSYSSNHWVDYDDDGDLDILFPACNR